MRVVRVAEFGGPDVLRIATDPDEDPGPGQVVVDAQPRRGVAHRHGDPRRARRCGLPGAAAVRARVGAAGTVTAAGEGVGREWIGRRALADVEEGGGYAERITTEVERTAGLR